MLILLIVCYVDTDHLFLISYFPLSLFCMFFSKMHDPVVQYSPLLLWFSGISFCCSYLWWPWPCIFCLPILQLWSLFLRINKLFLALSVSMVLVHAWFSTVPVWPFFLTPSTHHLVSGLFLVAVSLMMSLLFLNIATGFEMGGGEAVSAQNQPGTPRQGRLRCIFFQASLFGYLEGKRGTWWCNIFCGKDCFLVWGAILR